MENGPPEEARAGWRRLLGAIVLAALFGSSVWRLATVPTLEKPPVDVVSRSLQGAHDDLARAVAQIPEEVDVRLVDETSPRGNRKMQRAVVLGYVLMPRRLVREEGADWVFVVLDVRPGAPSPERERALSRAGFPPAEWERLGVYAGDFVLLRRAR